MPTPFEIAQQMAAERRASVSPGISDEALAIGGGLLSALGTAQSAIQGGFEPGQQPAGADFLAELARRQRSAEESARGLEQLGLRSALQEQTRQQASEAALQRALFVEQGREKRDVRRAEAQEKRFQKQQEKAQKQIDISLKSLQLRQQAQDFKQQGTIERFTKFAKGGKVSEEEIRAEFNKLGKDEQDALVNFAEETDRLKKKPSFISRAFQSVLDVINRNRGQQQPAPAQPPQQSAQPQTSQTPPFRTPASFSAPSQLTPEETARAQQQFQTEIPLGQPIPAAQIPAEMRRPPGATVVDARQQSAQLITDPAIRQQAIDSLQREGRPLSPENINERAQAFQSIAGDELQQEAIRVLRNNGRPITPQSIQLMMRTLGQAQRR